MKKDDGVFMATMAPVSGGYTTHIQDPYHTTLATNQPFTTMPMSTSGENGGNIGTNGFNGALKARKRTKTGCMS